MVSVTVRRHSPNSNFMSVSESYRTFVLDQIGRVAERVRIKAMFGGAGVYAGEFFFALVDDDVLYLKVDDVNRPDFEARGMQAFRPFGEGGEVMQYYQLPEELLEDPESLRPWVDKAIAVAARKKRMKSAPRAKPAKAKSSPKRKKAKPRAFAAKKKR
jgi:DNA transformation protein